MDRDTSRFHQRLLGRMLLLVALPAAIVLGVVITLAVSRGFSNLKRASEEALPFEAALIAAEIEGVNRMAVVSAERMAQAQMAGMFGDRAASLEFARRVLESASEFTGAYFGYEPNADGGDAEDPGSLPAGATDETGRFIPYWFRAPKAGDPIELQPLVDMAASLYYQGVKEAFAQTGRLEPMVTEPYVYEGKMIVEQTFPIVINGAFAGVGGVDRALSDVERALREFVEPFGGDAFLISSRGKFIAATSDPESDTTGGGDGQLKTQAIADTVYRDLFTPAFLEDGRDTGITVMEDPVDLESAYFARARIPTGGWTLVLRKSERAIVAPIYGQLAFGVTIATLGMLLVFALLVISIVRVSRRVRIAAGAAERIARGDLTETVDPGATGDETGALLRAIKGMTDSLNTLVGDVKQASIQLNSTATQLAATSREQESTVNTFGSSANQIAAASKEISATSGELVTTMSDVNERAGSTADLATTGQAGLEEMERTMRDLDQATGSIAGRLAAINERASNITGVVTTINKVADQTNLLSVNAAIEAEKAGEYGVGFLVVAREIRRLADQTAAATLDIEQMVEQMRSAVSAGVMEMDRFADHVRRSVGSVAEISRHLGQIIEQVNTNVESFQRVNEGMQSQSEGADQISEAMQQLTSGATRTMEATREYANAAGDLQTSIASLKSSIASFRLRA